MVGNLFWGMQFRTCKNFWDFADSKSSLNPKNSYKYKSHTTITSIVVALATNLKNNLSLRGSNATEAIQSYRHSEGAKDSKNPQIKNDFFGFFATLRMTIFLFLATLFTPLSANESFAPNHNHAITIITENDAYFEPLIKSDKYYTGGHYVSYLSPEFAQSWVNKIAGFSHLYDRHFTRFAVALKQEIYTPDKTNRYDTIAPTDDMLFGAGLYGSFAIISRTRDFMEQFSLDIGVVGPLAFGGETQNFIHRVTKNNAVWGWGVKEGALQNEVLINLHYGLIWRWVFIEDFFDVLPSIQISLGNALTAANVGIKFRVGYGIKNDFGSPKFKSRFHQNIISDGLKIYAVFGVNGSIIGRDIFIQGNTGRNQSAVAIKRFLYEIEVGAMIGWKYLSFGYIWSNESPRFKGQPLHHKYGSMRLEITF